MNLDDDLAAWAAAARLPDERAEAIFRAIIATGPAARPAVSPANPLSRAGGGRHVLATTTPGLRPEFWRRHTAGLAAGLVAATAPVRYAA